MVKLVEHSNGNVGMVVAGYSAADTRKAARVVAEYKLWMDKGMFTGTSLEITPTTYNSISVSPSGGNLRG